MAWGDYDQDGDLDFVSARQDTNGIGYICFYRHDFSENAAPASPVDLSVTWQEGEPVPDEVRLSWEAASDSETPSAGLSYNLRMGTSPGGIDIVSPMSDLTTGQLHQPTLGNVGINKFWRIKGLGVGTTYYWSVQAIDQAYHGGPFAPEASFTLDTSLPVELASFSAEVDDNTITLNWTTLSEVNNFGFDLERSGDGEAFEHIVFIPGNGTTNEPQFYTFDDELPGAAEIYYYRLRQVDTNGSAEYSKVLQVSVSPPESFALHQNFPNPFNPETRIAYALPSDSRVRLIIYDIRGHKIKTLVDDWQTAGLKETLWDGRNEQGFPASSGLYFYRLTAGPFASSKRMFLIR